MADDVVLNERERQHAKFRVEKYTDDRETQEFLRDYWDEEIDRLSAMS